MNLVKSLLVFVGSETHFKVFIASDAFEGLTLLQVSILLIVVNSAYFASAPRCFVYKIERIFFSMSLDRPFSIWFKTKQPDMPEHFPLPIWLFVIHVPSVHYFILLAM